MGLETSTYIDGLNTNNPAATDGLAQADDHIRLLKTTVKNTLPNITGPVTATQAELNVLDGTDVTTASLNKLQDVTATAAELNRLDGITASTTELNYTDGVTSNIQTQLNAKASTGITISAGGGLTGGGSLSANRTISHSNTSSQSSIDVSSTSSHPISAIKKVTIDTYGHVTDLAFGYITTTKDNLGYSPQYWRNETGNRVANTQYYNSSRPIMVCIESSAEVSRIEVKKNGSSTWVQAIGRGKYPMSCIVQPDYYYRLTNDNNNITYWSELR
jgi:hypothetical protein